MTQQSPYIEMKNVSKRFRRNMTNLRSTVGYVLGTSSHDDFWAVKNISLQLVAGESLGIIGPNGAGKSTILKILTHITRPTKGSITVRGRIGALIEVGAGFHPELTGRENIFLYGAILGMNKKEISEKFDSIVAFSELHKVLDTPVKFYSTGMYLRLGFAVTVHLDPDILIIDEAMAVGDIVFQEKCFKKIEEFRSQGKIIIVVSHDLQLIERYASSCIVLHAGSVVKAGTPQECTRWYHEEIVGSRGQHTVLFPDQEKSQSIIKMEISQDGIPSILFQNRTNLCIETTIVSRERDSEIVLGLGIFSEGYGVFGIEKKVRVKNGATSLKLEIPNHPFLKGTYTIRAGIWRTSIREVPIDYHDAVLSFRVEPSEATKPYGGVVLIPHTLQ